MSPATVLPLDVFGCPLDGVQLIEASAGTGKTWNICGLVLRLLAERGLTVQQILVVTFTNAATAELRDRIRGRIVDTLAGLRAPAPAPGGDEFVPRLLARLRALPGHDDAALALRLEQALQGFDEAAIFTIHGFCQRALADAPFTAQVPLAQELLHDDGPLLRQAVCDVWRQRVAGAADGEPLDPALVALLQQAGDTPERWARLLKRQLARPLSRPLWPADIDAPADGAAQQQALQGAWATARGLWLAQRDAVVQLLQRARTRFNASTYSGDALALATAGWDAVFSHAAVPAPAALPPKIALYGSALQAQRLKKDQALPVHAFFDAAQALLDALAASDRALRLARLRLLRAMIDEGASQLRAAKRERRVVAFDDLLYNLHERLAGAQGPALAAALAARYPAALIDEFQDTDPLQFAVFDRIHGQGGAPLFLVGDPKQAIYSFRHADLHTYLRARAQAARHWTLGDNQRAVEPLIAALNRLFGGNPQAFMQPGLDYHPVAFGAKPRPRLVDGSAARAALQLWTLPTDRRGELLTKAEAQAGAADATAAEIARLLTEAGAGRITLDGRALRAGDIAVLVRSHAQGALMRRALAAAGVASVELSQASVFHSPDAEALQRVLAAIAEHTRDGLLKAALATRWLGLDAAALQALAGDEAALMARMQRASDDLARWRERGLGFMLRHWLHAEGVPQRLLAQPDGPRRLTNLLHLAELLHRASAEHTTPEALLRWLQAQRDDPRGDEASQLRLESDQNLVQIVTIHKSKGLEYPLVFCPLLWDGRTPATADGLDGITRHDAKGQPVVDFRKGLDDDFDDDAARSEARLEAAAEGLRLIYVALTRAVQRCTVVVGSYRARAGKGWSVSESGRSLLNWLVAGGARSPAEWLKLGADPATVAAAWQALADGGTGIGIGLAPLPAGPGGVAAPLPGDGAALQALAPPAHLPTGWWIGSYSALAHGSTHERAAIDHDLRAAVDHDLRAAADHDLRAEAGDAAAADEAAAPAPDTRGALPADDILRFPRGAAAGDCVHAVFERAEFTDTAAWPQAITQALQDHGLPVPAAPDAAPLPAMLRSMLADVLATPLPLGTAQPLRLDTLPAERRLAELEFHLHAPRLAAGALNALLARHGLAVPRLSFGELRGYLKGFIDLVFAHEGRYFVADWKSNHLGERPADYAGPALAAAMAAQGYHLQALIYSLALHRWLQQRLDGYDHARHFGGAAYLFVRGLRPGWRQADGRPTGLHVQRASLAVLDELAALLDGAAVPASSP